MKTRVTRRQLAAALAAPAILAQVPGQPVAPAALLQQARDQVKAIGDLLQRQDVPMDVEPAFAFRA